MDRIAAFLLYFLFIVLGVPDEFKGDFYIGPVPIDFIFFFISCIVFIVYAIKKIPFQSTQMAIPLSVLFLLLLVGFVYSNEIKWMVIDVIFFTGLVAGYAVVDSWGTEKVLKVISNLCYILLALGFLTLIGLLIGLVPSNSYLRLYTHSLLSIATILMMLAPLFIITNPGKKGFGRYGYPFLVYILLFGIAILSSTRSILIGTCISLLLVAWFGMKSRIVMSSVLLVVYLGAILVVFHDIDGSSFSQMENQIEVSSERLSSTDLREEARFKELESMFEGMSAASYVTGSGFGSRFITPLPKNIKETEGLAFAPHVGVFAYLFKGGVVLFLFYVLLPLVLSIRVLMSSFKNRRVAVASAIGVLAYIVSSSMSGGWSPIILLSYGIVLALLKKNTTSRLPFN